MKSSLHMINLKAFRSLDEPPSCYHNAGKVYCKLTVRMLRVTKISSKTPGCGWRVINGLFHKSSIFYLISKTILDIKKSKSCWRV